MKKTNTKNNKPTKKLHPWLTGDILNGPHWGFLTCQDWKCFPEICVQIDESIYHQLVCKCSGHYLIPFFSRIIILLCEMTQTWKALQRISLKYCSESHTKTFFLNLIPSIYICYTSWSQTHYVGFVVTRLICFR
jgi:hypothetical protein